jgi:hypothetical protein
MFVSNDRLALVLGNLGEGELPAGQDIEFRIRGVMAETVTLGEALLPGTSVSLVFEDQVIYQSQTVLAIVDPDNVIPEEDDNNNGIAKLLAPDVVLDLAVHNVFAANAHGLLVVLQNRSDAPLVQAEVVITVYLGDALEPTTISPPHVLNIEPGGFDTVEVVGVTPLPGWHVRVVVELTELPDINPSNNEWNGTVS